ncbi:MAG: hypothetical protein ABEI13_02875, partial [Candidatus Paceibacteria bacterium]
FERKVIEGLKNTLNEPECKTLFIELHKQVMGESALSDQDIDYIYNLLNEIGFKIDEIQHKGPNLNIEAKI